MTEERHLLDKIYEVYQGILPEKLRPFSAEIIMLFIWVVVLVFVGHEFGLNAAFAVILFMGALYGIFAIFILPGEIIKRWKKRKK